MENILSVKAFLSQKLAFHQATFYVLEGCDLNELGECFLSMQIVDGGRPMPGGPFIRQDSVSQTN
eukprot:scaffold4663_cov109-Cylindrotheca_fusiformis.AAC.12